MLRTDGRDRRDRGSASLTMVLLTPVFVVVAFAAFQAALWSHARTQARTMARDVAVVVAQRGGDDDDLIAADAAANLNAADVIADAEVVIDRRDGLVVVTVAARAPGIIRWSSAEVEATEVLPIEGFRR